MLPFKIAYSEKYFLPIGEHVFRADKFRLIRERLLEHRLAEESDFIAPTPATEADLLLVHSPLYVAKLTTGTLSAREELEMEIPYSPQVVDTFMLHTGGSIFAAEQALREGICVNLGGGFHHAFPDHGEGFCMLHDFAVAIRAMQKRGFIARAMTIDCDVHQGNGTAVIFGGAPRPASHLPAWGPNAHFVRRGEMLEGPFRDVFTISLHQENNYPFVKPASSLDVNLPDGCDDSEYLNCLRIAIDTGLSRFEPELICYVAGADPFCEDQLGGLNLTLAGLMQRDHMVLRAAAIHNIPVMVALAGGYALQVEDTVTIHTNTVIAAAEVYRRATSQTVR